MRKTPSNRKNIMLPVKMDPHKDATVVMNCYIPTSRHDKHPHCMQHKFQCPLCLFLQIILF